MFFADLQESLLSTLRVRIRNGEMTERSLARLAGISQPHMHNVLSGRRSVTPVFADRILHTMRLSVADLIDPASFRPAQNAADLSTLCYLPVLEGPLGPSHPWPARAVRFERFPVPANIVRRMWRPVVAFLSDDVRMLPLFAAGDIVLLDQSYRARTHVDPKAFYILKRGRVGFVRRLKVSGNEYFAVAEDASERKDKWELICTDGQHLAHTVRAKALFIGREDSWDAG